MKKFFIKGLALVSAVVLSLGIAGCGGMRGIDPNKTQLYVGLYDGGWGSDWLDDAKARFEAEYQDYQVIITKLKDEYEYATLKNNIATDFNDMYITACSYYNYIKDDQILDITDAVTEDMADLGEPGNTVESKMDEVHRAFYKTADNKYYAVPFGSSVWGLNYDVDLFEEQELFISTSNGTGNGITWTSGKEGAPAKSAGRDGKTGTYDDGCPVTWADFQALLRRMQQRNITPFIWSKELGYRNQILLSLWADSEGSENFEKIKTLSGTFTDYTGAEQTLSEETGYKINLMQGKYNAVEFAAYISSNGYFDGNSGTFGFTETQDQYIDSRHSQSIGKGNRIAFLIDGGHWYNEDKAYIEQTNQERYPEDYGKTGRRFSVMPFPVFGDETNTTATYLESSHEFSMFVNAQTNNADLATLFIRFLCTDESLRKTTMMSGLHRNYNYTLDDDELAEMPYYYQQLYKLQSSPDVDIVSVRQSNDFYIRNQELASIIGWVFQGSFRNNQGTNTSLNEPFDDFRYYTNQGLTVEKYVQGSYQYYANQWGTMVQ